jgi:hypothetical protein
VSFIAGGIRMKIGLIGCGFVGSLAGRQPGSAVAHLETGTPNLSCRVTGGNPSRALSGRSLAPPLSLLAAAFIAMLAVSCSTPLWPDEKPRDLPILQRWSGDYPVAQIDRLPEGQRQSRLGYLGDAATFGRVWQGLKPGTAVPAVDFSTHIVVFARNLDFYNQTLISKVVLWHGAAEIVAAETLSARPVADTVAMALALIPRAGIEFIQTGKERVPVH